MANETLGASFAIDVTNLKAGLAQANRMIRESESEFKAAAAGMDDWSKSEDGLNAKIKSLNNVTEIQRKKVDALQKEYDRLIADGLDPTSKQATELRTKINNETAALNKNEAELKKQTKALEELGEETDDAGKEMQKLGDSADKSSGKLGGLKKVAGGVVGGIAAIGAACTAAVGAFLGLAGSTREYREDMAKLQTGFKTAGFSAEQATKTYKDFFAVLGEEDRSVEAVNHIAKLTSSQEELDKWTTICAGVWGTFGDSLPIEGLTEAANETAKVGKVTGPLADALNWAGVSEDAFNESLAACNSEQERSALITNTLNGLYSEAAENYKELNGDVMDAQRAQSELTDATATLGAVAEPIMTMLKLASAELLSAITPFVQLFGEGLTGAFNGAADAEQKLADGLSGVLTTAFEKIVGILPTVLNVIVTMIPAVLQAITSALPTIVDAVVSAIPLIVDVLLNAIPQLIECLSTIIVSLLDGLGTLLPQIVQKIIDIIPMIVQSLVTAIPQLMVAAIQFLMAIVQAIPTLIQNLLSELPKVIDTILTAFLQAMPELLDAAIQLFMAIVEALPVILDALIENLPTIIETIISFLVDSIPQMLDGAIQLLMAIIQALPTIIDALVVQLPKIINTITTTLLNNIPTLVKASVQLFMGIVKAIPQIITELVKQMPKIISSIVKGLEEGVKSVKEVGKNLIKGLWEGISDMVGWIGDKVKGFGENILGGLKSFFGINSPSKLMENVVGKNIALGIGKGFADNISDVNKDISDAIDFDDPKSPTGNPRPRGGVVVYQTNNYSQAHSRYELYKSKQQTAAAVRLAIGTV